VKLLNKQAKAILDRLLEPVLASNLLAAPCVFCGYNGANYYQRGSHKKACPFHDVGGETARARHLTKMVDG